MKRPRILFTALILMVALAVQGKSAVPAQAPRKIVACIGNSITYGVLLNDREKNAYPSVLQQLLGENYQVVNLGKPGAHLMRGSYVKSPEYRKLFTIHPDIIIVKLGTNDSRNDFKMTKEEMGRTFYTDYCQLVDSLKTLTSNICLCVPVYPFGEKWKARNNTLKKIIRPVIKQVAKDKGLKVIDLYKKIDRKASFYKPDGIHPTEEGYEAIAQHIFKVLQK
ncbi:MAG: GDSL-type esterase/lipase family protein [Mangrovibacterium sp.]